LSGYKGRLDRDLFFHSSEGLPSVYLPYLGAATEKKLEFRAERVEAFSPTCFHYFKA
jgi:hypothetical protein